MSSNRRKFRVKHPVVVDIGCSCRRPKISSFFFFFSSSSKKAHNNTYPSAFSPSTASLTTATTTNASSSSPSPSPSSFSPSNLTSSSQSQAFCSPPKKQSVAVESVAVEKESADPYVDFRDSILQMIVEKEIYSWGELRELLQLFLSLNSPHHHHLILQAFAEILNGVFSPAER